MNENDEQNINNIDVNELISHSIRISCNVSLLIVAINHLSSTYFFNKSTIYYNGSSIVRRTFNNEISSSIIEDSDAFIICVDLHNRILIISKHDYDILTNSAGVTYSIETENDLSNVISKINEVVIKVPVKMYFNLRDTKKYISILHDTITINMYDSKYEIQRNIFDMLYAEHEDFCPTVDINSNVIIRTQARHQLIYNNELITDLLHSDIALICDIQDKLITEYTNINTQS